MRVRPVPLASVVAALLVTGCAAFRLFLRGTMFDVTLCAAEVVVILLLTHTFRKVHADVERAARAAHAAHSEALEANHARDMFLAFLSHELRTPLSVMTGWTTALQHRTDDREFVTRAVAGLDRATRLQTRLIEDLLDWSRASVGKLAIKRTRMPIGPIIAAAIEDLRPALKGKHLRLETRLGPDAILDADPVRLSQVFTNLVANSIKFTPEHGRILIDVTITGSHVDVCIEDTGAGIPAERLPYIFEAFQQANPARDRLAGGLGLGLSIARRVVELHGGRITAASDGSNRGCRFNVILPLAREEPPLV